MKQALSLLLAVLLCWGLAACGTTKPSAENPAVDVDTMDVTSMYNQETKKSISLGMTKEEVETIAGKGMKQEQLPPNVTYFYDENAAAYAAEVEYDSYGKGEDFLVVTYRNNQAISLSNFGNFEGVKPGPSHWCVKYGISYGASLQDIMEKYGKVETYPMAINADVAAEGQGILDTPNVSWKEPVGVYYLLNKDGKPVKNIIDEKVQCQLTFFVDEAQDGLMWYVVGL